MDSAIADSLIPCHRCQNRDNRSAGSAFRLEMQRIVVWPDTRIFGQLSGRIAGYPAAGYSVHVAYVQILTAQV